MDCSDNSKKFKVDSESGDSLWWTVPEPIFVEILSYLSPRDILNAGATCQRWYDMSNDNIIWKKKFQTHYKTDHNIGIRPGGFLQIKLPAAV